MTTPDPKRWQALAVLGVAYLMVVLDVSIVNVALPSIQKSLGFSTSGLEWVVSGYALTFGGFLLLGGRLGDLLGRRRVFMVGLALFSLFSLLCGLSVSPAMLIAARVLQGAAGAILSPSVFSIVSVTFEEGSERNKALGILGAIAGSGAAIGLLLGGVLTEFASWEWIFFVNVPIGLGMLLLVPRVVTESRAPEMARHFDVSGAVTVTGSLMLLVYGLTRAPTVGWGSAETIGALVGFAVLMAAALVIEQRSRSPLIDLKIFRRRTLTGANVIALLLGTMLVGMFFLLSLYQQDVLGYSPLRTGVHNLAIALTVIAASAVSQSLVTRIGVKPVLTAGLVLLGAGFAYYTQISPNGSYVTDLLPGFLMTGTGLGFSFVPISIAALGGITNKEAGLASGLITTSQQIGGGIGLAVLSTVSTTRTNNLLASGVAPPEALTDGFRLAFWVGVGIAIAAVTTTLVVLRGRDVLPAPAAPLVACAFALVVNQVTKGEPDMSYGILSLRLVLGAIMAAHGSQKLFGWFGGGGPRGTANSFAQLGYSSPLLMALGAGLAELGGGLLIALGLLTPLAAAAIAIVMLNAIAAVHWRNGFFNAAGGYEFNLLVFTAAVATAATGPGRFSLDNLYGWAGNISGLWWGVGVAGVAVLVSALTLTVGRGAWMARGRREDARPASPGTAAR